MASRMDRYYQGTGKKMNRSTRNKELYKDVYNGTSKDLDTIKYVNTANEIDISKLKSMVNNRETYKKEKKLRQTVANSRLKIDIPDNNVSESSYDINDLKIEKNQENVENPKNHDLSDVLNKAKNEYNEDDSKNRNLKNLEYKELNNLNLRKKEYKDGEAELKDLIKSIHDTKKIEKLDDDVGLLDDLKADTMIGNDTSIKKVLEEERREEKKDDTKELDKSFFTSSFDFADEDFDEELARKKGNKKKIIITIIIALVVATILVTLYFLGIINFKIK